MLGFTEAEKHVTIQRHYFSLLKAWAKSETFVRNETILLKNNFVEEFHQNVSINFKTLYPLQKG